MTQTSVQTCLRHCNKLGITFSDRRIIVWLSRVGMRQQGKPYTPDQMIPDAVYKKLARLLELRVDCEYYLKLLNWDWNHPTVNAVEQKYNCTGELPLRGYLELQKELEDSWLIHGGGF